MKYVAFLILFIAPFFVSSQTFDINTDRATVEFEYVTEKTTGTLGDVKAVLNVDVANLNAAKVSGSVDVSTLSTGNKMRDKHLRSKDFFHIKEYPTMKFESSSMYQEGDAFFAKGKLTIKEVTKEVVFRIINREDALLFKTTIHAADYDVAIKKDREKSKVNIVVTIPVN